MNDDWKDNLTGAIVTTALVFALVSIGLFVIYLARSIL